MSIDIRWYDEAETILLFEFQEGWAWEDFIQAGNYEWLASIEHPFYEIYDLRHASQLPPNIIRQGQTLLRNDAPANLSGVYVVGISPTLKTIMSTFQKLMPDAMTARWKLRLVRSMDDALAAITQQKDAMPPV